MSYSATIHFYDRPTRWYEGVKDVRVDDGFVIVSLGNNEFDCISKADVTDISVRRSTEE